MPKDEKLKGKIESSHEHYLRLIEEPLKRLGLVRDDGPSPYLARIILDFPLGWAFTRLEGLDSIVRARTLVVTQASHPAYLDCLASFHVSGVVNATDEPSLLSGIYSAATAQRTYHWKSNLTYMELRVSRALLQGLDTKEIALRLSISAKTVNAHVSNVLCKTGTENRSQYLAQILAHH